MGMRGSTRGLRRGLVLVATVALLAGLFAVIPASAEPGVPPDITGVSESDQTIDPGETRFYKVAATGVDSPATATFSGDGVTATVTSYGGTLVRLSVTAATTASGGPRDLTIINPDGLSDTFAAAITVTGAQPPPDQGDLTGHVFEDLDGNSIEDGADTGLAGVVVDVTDSLGATYSTATDGSGNFTLVDLSVGAADVDFTTPGGYGLTTGNSSQSVTIVVDSTVAAGDVGYTSIPSGDVTGHVFADLDGNGVEDGADTGLSGVAVSVTDFNGSVFNASTDASGNYTVAGLAVGDATAAYTTPASHTLTTTNGVQTVTVTDGGLATAAAVGYEPPVGTPPDITSINESDQDIDPGETRFYKVLATDVVSGATATFSGDGLTATIARLQATQVRLSVTASASASGGLRDLTITNPDGLSDTLTAAILVTGDGTPPDTGDVTGRVFEDLDGNGVEDGSDVGFAGVAVTITDALGAEHAGVTDATGDYTVVGVAVGEADVVTTTPPGSILTTTNASQTVTVVLDGSVAADPVGYQPGAPDFADVTAAAGIELTHSAAVCGGPPIGVGAAWADIDNDGDQDLFTTDQNGPNHMYRNDGDTDADGTPDFTDIAVSLGIDAAGANSFAAVFADIDNDGDQDLFVGDNLGNTLWENQLIDTGSVAFTNISATAGLFDEGRVETATFGDVDNDGYLDLYIAKHMSCVDDNDDHLFHNNGDNTFTDWTTYLCDGVGSTCADVDGLGFMAAIFDYNQDGWQDIYLVNDNITNSWQPNKMWMGGGPDGAGGWIFTEVGDATNTDHSVNGMGLGLGDYNNDGWIDLAFSDAAPGHLLANNGDGTYADVSSSSGVTAATADDAGWGTAFFDYDNDGWQDLFFAVGSIGTPALLANSLLRNDGDGTFTNVSDATGMNNEERGRAVAVADFDGNGWADVFVGNYDAPPALMQNNSDDNGNTNNWVTITVEGTESNRDGIGTELVLTTSHGTQRQAITSGSNHGGGSQKAAFFGLGSDTIGSLTVHWPNGATSPIGQVSAGAVLHFVEPATTAGDVTGHVFEDLDGNGVEDGADSGLAGVNVTITDALGGVHVETTDGSGNFIASGVAEGDADVAFATPGGYALSSGSAAQTVAVVDGGSVATADVGYEPIPSRRPCRSRLLGRRWQRCRGRDRGRALRSRRDRDRLQRVGVQRHDGWKR